MAAFCGPAGLYRNVSPARVDPHVQVHSVVLRESPRPQARGRFHGRFHRRFHAFLEETLAFQSPPALPATPKDSAVQSRRTAVSSATVVSATSIRPTLNQTCARAARSVCLPGRPMHVGGRGLNQIDRSPPLVGRSRPASPGAFFIPPMACVAVHPRRGVGHVLLLGAPAVRGEGQSRGRLLGALPLLFGGSRPSNPGALFIQNSSKEQKKDAENSLSESWRFPLEPFFGDNHIKRKLLTISRNSIFVAPRRWKHPVLFSGHWLFLYGHWVEVKALVLNSEWNPVFQILE